jgi:acyl-CoA thioester hydrolase
MTRTPPDRLDHDRYPYLAPVVARYADVDPLWHINNVAMAQYFEDTRISLLREILGLERMALPDGRLVLAHVAIDYLREGRYPGMLEVGAAVTNVGRTSVRIGLALFQDDACIALSDAVLVRVGSDGPSPWTADERKVLDEPAWRLQHAGDATHPG